MRRRMATIALDQSLSLQIGRGSNQLEAVIEEIEGLIKVYKDGHVERLQVVPYVSTGVAFRAWRDIKRLGY